MKEAKLSKPEVEKLKHHTRRLSIKEGIFWSVRASFGDYYISPFVIAMGIGNSLVTIINSIWSLGPVSQLFGSKLIGKYKRKPIITKSVSIESLGWLLMAVIGLLYFKSIWTTVLPFLVILDLLIIVFAIGVGHPAWFSWMGDVVDEKFRGRWFSKRSTIISFTTIVLAISAALILEYFRKTNNLILGFIILFLIAFIARFSCVKILNKHYEPEFKVKKQKKYSLWNFIKESKKTNFGKFTMFRSMFAMSMWVTAPLVSIYLLRYLEFNYLTYIIISLSGILFSVITLNLWGKIADKYGNYKVIALTTILIPLTPLLWILSSSKVYLFLIPAIIGGTSWTAFMMASRNFIYDNTSQGKRGKAISYFNLFAGLGAFVGGLIGALLIKTINTTWIEPLFLIFLIGMVARMLVVAFWIPKLKETKKKQKLRGAKELERLIIKEAKPTILEDLHEIVEIKDYLGEK